MHIRNDHVIEGGEVHAGIDILPGLKAEDSRIRLYSYFEPQQILFAGAAEMFASSPIHGLIQMTWYFSRRTG